MGDIVSESPGDFKSVYPGDFVGIRIEPLRRVCLESGHVTAPTVAGHVEPH